MSLLPGQWLLRMSLVAMMSVAPCRPAGAGPLREWLAEHRLAQDRPVALPTGVRVDRDVAYGDDARQRFDVYFPQQPPQQGRGAPVIFMVHGGAWQFGDKAAPSVVESKVARWLPRGLIVISTNYRLLPQATPAQQAEDVARALAAAQKAAASWGADPGRFILMGHSAGAHLVALLAASPALAATAGAAPWLGVIALDSAALNVPEIMNARHPRLYDRAFGADPADWASMSPFHLLTDRAPPFLMVCSTQRDDACPQARRFIARAESLGGRASVLAKDLSHGDINRRLGEAGAYTQAVEAFMGSLDASLATTLADAGHGSNH